MKIVILDDGQKRKNQIIEALKKGRHDVTGCHSSNDFFDAFDAKSDLVMLDMETWDKGKSIYNYFDLPKKLEKTPILFYNAEEGFATLDERSRNDKDQVLYKPSEIENIVEAAQLS